MFYIRTDANRTIATGHVMRCIAIAKQLSRLGESTTFITADHEADELIADNGFNQYCLDTKWDSMEEELDRLIALIQEKKIKVMLLDSYYVTSRYMKVLSDAVKVVYLDDINKFPYPVHTVINYGIQAQQVPYIKSAKHYMLGCSYIPLREEFSDKYPHTNKDVEHILITTGGTDPFNMAGRLITQLKEDNPDFHLHVVSGKLNTHWNTLKELENMFDGVTIYSNVHNMGELMNQCDLAVSAAGTTLYELCALGVPTISFTFADNQIPGAKVLDQKEIIDYAGDLRQDLNQCIHKIKSLVKQLDKDFKLREEKGKRMQLLVDGKGAERIASYCIQLQREEFK